MKYQAILISILFMTTAAAAQDADDCYPGLGLCEDAVTAQKPLPSRINIGTPEQPAATGTTGQTTQQTTQQQAPPANPICIVYDVRPPDAWLALRTEPSSRTGARLYKLPSGTRIEMLGPQDGTWHLVRVPDDTIGWISWQEKRWIAC